MHVHMHSHPANANTLFAGLVPDTQTRVVWPDIWLDAVEYPGMSEVSLDRQSFCIGNTRALARALSTKCRSAPWDPSH
jgi:hypothetical protein